MYMCIYIYTLHGSRGAGRSFFWQIYLSFLHSNIGRQEIWTADDAPNLNVNYETKPLSPKLEAWGFSDCQTLFCNVTFTEPYFAQFVHSFWNGRKPSKLRWAAGQCSKPHRLYRAWNDLWYNTSLRMKRWGNPQRAPTYCHFQEILGKYESSNTLIHLKAISCHLFPVAFSTQFPASQRASGQASGCGASESWRGAVHSLCAET